MHEVVFSPDGVYLARASWDGAIWVWRVTDGGVHTVLNSDSVVIIDVAFSPDGSFWRRAMMTER